MASKRMASSREAQRAQENLVEAAKVGQVMQIQLPA